MGTLKVFTFSGAWGLRSTGPFALKLLKWLDWAGVPFEQVVDDLPMRGPKGKNPWVELDGNRIGDTEVIIALLAARFGRNIDAPLSGKEVAQAHAVRRMLEEHFHQVLEWELFIHPAGAAGFREVMSAGVPGLAVGPATWVFRRHFRKQLTARGIARHEPNIIAEKGIADLKALETLLDSALYVGGDHPCMADISAYGLLTPMRRWPMPTPVAEYLKGRPALLAYLDRLESISAPAAMPIEHRAVGEIG